MLVEETKRVTLRPMRGLGALKAGIVGGDLMFLALPVMIASIHMGAAVVALMAVVSLICIAAITFFGIQGLGMRVEVEPDAVYIYYFVPKPFVLPRAVILGVRTGMMSAGRSYAPFLMLSGDRVRAVVPLAVRTEAEAEEQTARLRTALRETEQ